MAVLKSLKLRNQLTMPLIGYGTYKLSDLPDDAKFTPADAIASAFKSGYLLYDLAFRYNVDDDFHTA